MKRAPRASMRSAYGRAQDALADAVTVCNGQPGRSTKQAMKEWMGYNPDLIGRMTWVIPGTSISL